MRRGTPSLPTPVPTAALALPNPTPVSMQAAWGNVHIVRLPTALPDNRALVFENAATPDGQWLVAENDPREFFSNLTGDGKRLPFIVLYNVATRHIVTLKQLLTPQSQVLYASADDHWVVWVEVDDNPTVFDWSLFAFNRQTGQVRELAQAVKENGQAVPGPFSGPVVDGDQVIWSQAVGPVSPQTIDNSVVRLENLKSGAVTTLATAAGDVNLAWPWALWAQVVPGTGGKGHVTLHNLISGQEVLLEAQPATVAISGTSIAYDDLYSVTLIDNITAHPLTPQVLLYGSNPGDHLQWVTLNNRLVAYTRETSVQVFDRIERRFVDLPISNGESWSWVNARLLIWLDPEPAAQAAQDDRNNLLQTPTIDVVDTSSLLALKPQ